MTTLRTAAQQALEALDKLVVGSEYEKAVEAERAMDALRAALEEPVQEELKPKLGKRAIKAFEDALAQVEKETAHAAEDWQDTTQMGYVVKPYTAPPQRKPLTEVELDQRYYVSTGQMLREQDKRLAFLFARAIERAHGIGEKDE